MALIEAAQLLGGRCLNDAHITNRHTLRIGRIGIKMIEELQSSALFCALTETPLLNDHRGLFSHLIGLEANRGRPVVQHLKSRCDEIRSI